MSGQAAAPALPSISLIGRRLMAQPLGADLLASSLCVLPFLSHRQPLHTHPSPCLSLTLSVSRRTGCTHRAVYVCTSVCLSVCMSEHSATDQFDYFGWSLVWGIGVGTVRMGLGEDCGCFCTNHAKRKAHNFPAII